MTKHDPASSSPLPAAPEHPAHGVLAFAQRQPSAADQLNALLSAPDAVEQIQALDAYTLHGLICEVGVSDAADVALLASHEQVQRFLDFDAWRGEALVPDAFEAWLQLYLEGLDIQEFGFLIESLDPELLPLYLKSKIKVFLADPGDDGMPPADAPENVESSPCYKYFISYPEDEDSGRFCRLLIRRMYDALGVMGGWRTLESTRWELDSQLEELSFQFRSQRLEEHGFRSFEDASQLFAPANPVKLREAAAALLKGDAPALNIGRDLAPLPPHFLSVIADDEARRGGFFAQAVALLDAQGWRVVQSQIGTLGNVAASAQRVEPGDRASAASAFRLALSYADVGLAYLSHQRLPDAAALLRVMPLREVVQAGHALLYRLAAKARALSARGVLSLVEEVGFSLLTDAEAALFEGLAKPRPVRDAATDEPFWSLQEVEGAAATLALVTLKVSIFFEVLRFDRAELAALVCLPGLNLSPADVHFDTLLATLILQHHLHGDLRLQPLEAAEVPTDADALRKLVADWFAPFTQGDAAGAAKRWQQRVTQALLDDLSHLSASAPLDPRFVRCLLLRFSIA
jgi:hypothetical protein